MSVTIQNRRDIAADWTLYDPILAEGEIGFETDTIKYKVGDGSSLWSALSYFAVSSYVHPTGDGNLHVPATGTSNEGKALIAGETAGSLSWGVVATTSASSAMYAYENF